MQWDIEEVDGYEGLEVSSASGLPVSIPEPSTLGLTSVLGGLIFIIRKKFRA